MFVPVVLAGLLVSQAEPEVPKEKAPSGSLPELSEDSFEQESDPADDAPAPELRSTAEWRKYVMAWRRDVSANHLPGYQFSQEAKQPLLSIRDQSAVPAIVALLKTERERRIRMAYMEALSKIGGKKALDTLVSLSLDDRDARFGYQRLAGELIGKMRNRREAIAQYAKSLKSAKTRDATFAALRSANLTEPVSPGELPDPALTASLIDGLLVQTRQMVPGYVLRGHGSSYSRSQGYSWRRTYVQGMVPVAATVLNSNALSALREYTSEDFGYDQDAWRRWYLSRKRGFSEELGKRDFLRE